MISLDSDDESETPSRLAAGSLASVLPPHVAQQLEQQEAAAAEEDMKKFEQLTSGLSGIQEGLGELKTHMSTIVDRQVTSANETNR